jgi:hypothetical protein
MKKEGHSKKKKKKLTSIYGKINNFIMLINTNSV